MVGILTVMYVPFRPANVSHAREASSALVVNSADSRLRMLATCQNSRAMPARGGLETNPENGFRSGRCPDSVRSGPADDNLSSHRSLVRNEPTGHPPTADHAGVPRTPRTFERSADSCLDPAARP